MIGAATQGAQPEMTSFSPSGSSNKSTSPILTATPLELVTKLTAGGSGLAAVPARSLSGLSDDSAHSALTALSMPHALAGLRMGNLSEFGSAPAAALGAGLPGYSTAQQNLTLAGAPASSPVVGLPLPADFSSSASQLMPLPLPLPTTQSPIAPSSPPPPAQPAPQQLLPPQQFDPASPPHVSPMLQPQYGAASSPLLQHLPTPMAPSPQPARALLPQQASAVRTT